AAAGEAPPSADVAGAGGAHLGAAGHAEGGVDGGAGDLLQELGGGVGLLGPLVSRRLLRNLLNQRGLLDQLTLLNRRSVFGGAQVADDFVGRADLLDQRLVGAGLGGALAPGWGATPAHVAGRRSPRAT